MIFNVDLTQIESIIVGNHSDCERVDADRVRGHADCMRGHAGAVTR